MIELIRRVLKMFFLASAIVSFVLPQVGFAEQPTARPVFKS